MPREKKFYFQTYKPTYGRKAREKNATVSISAKGMCFLSKSNVEALGEEFDTKLLRLYIDRTKKAIGFKFVKSTDLEELKENGLKTLEPKSSKNGYQWYSFSLRGALAELGVTELPIKGIEIQTYIDKDEYIQLGKVYYIQL